MMTSPLVDAGGRSRARLFVLALAAVIASGPGVAASELPSQVVVTEEDGVYTLNVSFIVDEPPAVALQVLTDFERIPRFMPDVKTSIVLERSERRVVVEQEAVARVMLFSKRVHLRLEVVTDEDSVEFRDTCGRSFEEYAGAWHLFLRKGRTHVTYHLRAKPAFAVPPFLLTRLLKKDANGMIDRLRAEMTGRATTGTSSRVTTSD